MRLFPVFALVACLVPGLSVSAEVFAPERHGLGGLAVREATLSTTTATETFSDTTAASVTNHAAAKSNLTTTSNATAPAPTTPASLSTPQASNDGKNSTDPNALPIQPTVTPALGIGGFLLLVTGAVLALIGIRNLRVQVFLSTAFLTGLGVTVLIVYVMSPPVRVAIQGAYLVAIFFTGITFGALAIVFKELTEGLCCLLGGFCSSMWLLSLKPGGLLTGTNAKSGFIGAISVGFYAMSFSHHTRPYGLIVSTGISGGTAVALGIDCFSRAGLKEFWLYIWGLNDNIFPLGTDTYPITRNIRVELAATVIIAILGVVSQLRLWKVVRERRRREKEKRDDEQRKKEESEAELGRRLEEDNIQERKEWEAKYGDAKPASGKPEFAGDTKCRADEVDAMEKGDAYDSKSMANSSDCSYRCSDCREREANEDGVSDATGATEGAHDREQARTAKETSDKIQEECGSLPIKVFDGAAAAQMKDDKSSDMTAVIGSDTATIRSKRASGASCMPQGSRSNDLPLSQSREALVSVDDGTSSVHGTTDEGGNLDSACLIAQGESHRCTKDIPDSDEKPSVGDVGRQQAEPEQGPHDKQTHMPKNVNEATIQNDKEGHPMAASTTEPEKTEAKEGFDRDSHSLASEVALAVVNHGTPGQHSDAIVGQGKNDGLSSPPDEPPVEPVGEEGQLSACVFKSGDTGELNLEDHSCDRFQAGEPETPNLSPDGQDERSHGESRSPLASSQNENEKKREATRGKCKSPEPQPRIEPELTKESPKLNEETVKDLPKRTSRVVQTYRTNEWAKHLADAEAPELEPIKPIEEELPESSPEVEEAAVPVNILELLQTPLTAQPPPAVEPRVRDQPSRRDSHRISSGSQLHLYSHTDQPKKKIPQSPPPTAQPRFSNSYYMSTLIGNPAAIEQPQEDAETAKPQWKGPAPLIAVREDMMRNRLSSYSLSMDPFSRNNPGQPPTEGLRRSSTCRIRDEADDMPLSQRRAMLYQQTVPSPPPAHAPFSTSRRHQGHGPSPTNTSAAMAAWRECIQEDLKDKRNPLAKQNNPIIPPRQDRNPPSYSQSQRHSIHIGNAIAEGMQRGDMSELHREAMRRMQAKANKNVREA